MAALAGWLRSRQLQCKHSLPATIYNILRWMNIMQGIFDVYGWCELCLSLIGEHVNEATIQGEYQLCAVSSLIRWLAGEWLHSKKQTLIDSRGPTDRHAQSPSLSSIVLSGLACAIHTTSLVLYISSQPRTSSTSTLRHHILLEEHHLKHWHHATKTTQTFILIISHTIHYIFYRVIFSYLSSTYVAVLTFLYHVRYSLISGEEAQHAV